MNILKKKYVNLLKMLLPDNSYRALYDEPLRLHSSWKIGGPADILIEPLTKDGVKKIYSYARQMNYPIIVIGKGSNILFDDEGFRGIVLKMGKLFSNYSIEGTSIKADAGIFVPKLAFRAAHKGLTGLEHICGIPGTLGGLIYMNGGSLNKSIGQNVESVEAIDPIGETKKFYRDSCRFSYRKSIFQENDYLITNIELKCEKGDPQEINKLIKAIIQKRKNNFPINYPNCGSVFKIHEDLKGSYGPPGKIIDDAGLKGLCIGDAEVSSKHANFIINKGNAKSSDVLKLIKTVRDQVYTITGRHLKCEVQYVAPEGEMLPLHGIL